MDAIPGYSAIGSAEISILTQQCTVQMSLSGPSLKKCAVCKAHLDTVEGFKDDSCGLHPSQQIVPLSFIMQVEGTWISDFDNNITLVAYGKQITCIALVPQDACIN